MKIKDIPKDDRPRERLLSFGASNLTNQELLAVILKTGTKDKDVMDLSYEILKEIGKIENLKDINVNRLSNIKGIGLVKAISIVASIELGRRIYFTTPKIRERLLNAEDIYNNCKYLFMGKTQEEFYCLYFNNKQELLLKKLLFKGTFNRSVVHPREIFKEAYLSSASTIVCMHNHPSGDIKPSREDIIFTKSLIELGKINSIPIVDHIIVGDNSYYSFYEESDIF